MRDVIFLNSHPIQYFAPLYKFMNEAGIKTTAWYCSDETLHNSLDREFGVTVKWDIPLLDGYEYKFFKNYSWKPSHKNGFFGLLNFGILLQLFKIKKSIIVVHGWQYGSHLMVLLLGKVLGHTVCIRNDMPLAHECHKHGWEQPIKKFLLKYIVFPRINYFLYVGEQNKQFYQSYSLSAAKLIFCPYAVDNERFQLENVNRSQSFDLVRQQHGIPKDDKIIMFSGKYIEKKCPLDLLEAFIKLNISNIWLIMVGEGFLRKEMETLIESSKTKNVILTGFVNQSLISSYYGISDVFVMCSSLGENWGLSVNEAMNFDLPLILSDLTGCSDDLVLEGINGYIFPTGDIDSLTHKLRLVLQEGQLTWTTSSKTVVDKYSFRAITDSLKSLATI